MFDRGGQDAFDADAVGPHNRRGFLAIAIEDARAHRLGVLVTEFEDMTDLDRFAETQRQTGNGVRLTRIDIADIGIFVVVKPEIATCADIPKVKFRFVCT